ncbi:MAG: hypothetical protein HC908_12735 [Calothrix sp. SM1_7_51]|nr:hypothetical protein [Calothrix sp. SM1_7_51]
MWEKDISDIVQTVADEVERFFLGMSEIIDIFVEITGEITEHVQNTIVTEIVTTNLDQYLHEFAFDSIPELYWDSDEILADIDPGFPYYMEATQEKNPACIGCRHYHGHVYSGNQLVCGMYPSGIDADSCPDWEAEDLGF